MAKLLFTITEYTLKPPRSKHDLFRGNIQNKNTEIYLSSDMNYVMDKG